MASGLSLAQYVEGIINDFIAMKVHFTYHANLIAVLKCFINNCKLCQEEEKDKHQSAFLAREIDKRICQDCDGIATF